jgi:hypothetical protein
MRHTQSPMISWRSLRGKRIYHQLTPQMVAGTDPETKRLYTRPVPYRQFKVAQEYEVSFDRDYAVEKVRRDLTLPLSAVSLKDILLLVAEAYAIDHPGARICGLLDNLEILQDG